MPRRSLTLLSLGAAALTGWAALSVQPPAHRRRSAPAADYAEALDRVRALQAADDGRVNPACRTTLWSHGRTTSTAVGLLHGFTNCPAQYSALAEELHARGCNVLAPRLAHHGLQDLRAPDFAQLTVEQMVDLVHATADALQGLGERRVLIGLSLGGAMAAWGAQHRADLDHVVLIAPAIAPKGVPLRLRRFYANTLRRLPNRFVEWEGPVDAPPGPPHAYGRYSTRAVAQICRLGALLEREAGRWLFAADRVTVITNPCDDTVENRATDRLVAQWRRHGGDVAAHAFPAEWGLIHDMIDPTQSLQQTARVYPQLLCCSLCVSFALLRLCVAGPPCGASGYQAMWVISSGRAERAKTMPPAKACAV